jgi:hypothetical protein
MQRPRGKAIAVFVAATLLLNGCALFSGSPEPIRSINDDLQVLRPVFAPERVVDCITGVAEGGPKACRDRIVQAQLMATDLRYRDFERRFLATARGGRLMTQLGVLGLTTTAGAGGLAAGTAQVLSLVAGGLTGSLALAEQELLAERTALAIQAQMRAGRDRVARRIRNGLARPIEEYPLGVAMTDLEAYAYAGTLTGGIAALTEQAGADAQRASEDLVRGVGVSSAAAAVGLQRHIADPGLTAQQRVARQQEVERIAAELGFGRVIASSFVRDTRPEVAAQQTAVARRLGLVQ